MILSVPTTFLFLDSSQMLGHSYLVRKVAIVKVTDDKMKSWLSQDWYIWKTCFSHRSATSWSCCSIIRYLRFAIVCRSNNGIFSSLYQTARAPSASTDSAWPTPTARLGTRAAAKTAISETSAKRLTCVTATPARTSVSYRQCNPFSFAPEYVAGNSSLVTNVTIFSRDNFIIDHQAPVVWNLRARILAPVWPDSTGRTVPSSTLVRASRLRARMVQLASGEQKIHLSCIVTGAILEAAQNIPPRS
jgi:hypothetical protein